MLKYEHKLVLGMDDVVEGDDVFVLELFHERNLTDGGRRRSFFAVKVYFFQGDELAGLAISAFEHGSIGPFSELFQLLEGTWVSLLHDGLCMMRRGKEGESVRDN